MPCTFDEIAEVIDKRRVPVNDFGSPSDKLVGVGDLEQMLFHKHMTRHYFQDLFEIVTRELP